MCGLFAAVGQEVSEAKLAEVLRTLDHRGPDGRGTFVDPSVNLTIAHTRLAIIDLQTGAQPLQSENGGIILVANGEIYDFERIRSELERDGYRFKTRSDSEVILQLYRKFGLDCFDQLRGEFAFLLYDREKGVLIAARDRFGIKPLYMCRLPQGGVVFASEMKAIFASGLIAPKLNAAGFDPLSDQDSDHPQFPFENIEHVPPASYVVIDVKSGETDVRRYWELELGDEIISELDDVSEEMQAAAAQSVLEILEQSVRLRLRADVPVGVYLSGGIDSALVASLMKCNLNARPHSFSISFEGSERSEGESAAATAEFLGTEHHNLTVSKKMLWDNLPQALWFSELPFVTLAPVGKFLLSREAKKFVTVALTGEGADEVFLGYRAFFQKAIAATRNDRSASGSSVQTQRLKLGRLSSRLSLLIFNRNQRKHLRLARHAAGNRHSASKPPINAVQEARLEAMPFDILCYLGDREEMAHSLEGRLPFLDHHLYDLAKSIPVDLKIRHGTEKAVLRDAAKGLVPEEVRLRPKVGFMLTSEAIDLFGADRGELNRFRKYLSRAAFRSAGIFSYKAFVAASLVARLPPRTGRLQRLRRNSNKLLMYMMQAHMLNDMFVSKSTRTAGNERLIAA